MTEAEWLASTDPAAMLREVSIDRPSSRPGSKMVSDRKLRLFACAYCRQAWHLLTDERGRRAVEVAERYADGEATEQEMGTAWYMQWAGNFPNDLHHAAAAFCTAIDLSANGAWPAILGGGESHAIQAALLREIIGNPFRQNHQHVPFHKLNAWLTWNGGIVPRLAQAAYEERVGRECDCDRGQRPTYGPSYLPEHIGYAKCPDCHGTGLIESGELDPDRLAILADACEEAGCTDVDLLGHLRVRHCLMKTGGVGEPGEEVLHVRGCWVLDLLLGKS